MLLSDTVGFIRDLPHAFDCQLQGDARRGPSGGLAAARGRCQQSRGVRADRVGVRRAARNWALRRRTRCWCSTRSTGSPTRRQIDRLHELAIPTRCHQCPDRPGTRQLAATVSEALSRNFLDLDVETGVDNGRLLAYLAAHGEVLSQRYHDSRVVVHCRMSREHRGEFTSRPQSCARTRTALSCQTVTALSAATEWPPTSFQVPNFRFQVETGSHRVPLAPPVLWGIHWQNQCHI